MNNNDIFQEEKPEKKKYKRTPKKIRKIILETLKEVGGSIPNNYFHLSMLTARIVHKHNIWVDRYTVLRYLTKSRSVELKNGVFILKSLENNEEEENNNNEGGGSF